MGAAHGRAVEYGVAYRAHQDIDKRLNAAREVVTQLEEEQRKAVLRVNETKRLLLEEAQKS